MADFTIREILDATGGTLYAPSGFGDPVVHGFTIDTRTLTPGMGYVAIRGDTFDGHRFIPDAMEKGAVLSISDTDVPYPHIRVENTVLAYQNIAKIHRELLGQHKRQPEFPVVTRESRRNSRKTTWLPRHRKMKPFPATAPQEKSHVRNWRSKGHLAPLMRPTKFPEIPVSLERNPEVFRHPLL